MKKLQLLFLLCFVDSLKFGVIAEFIYLCSYCTHLI